MTIDVLLIDDQVVEGQQLREQWEHAGVRVIQSIGLGDFELYATGKRPAKWPEGEIDFKMAVVDMDLGHSSGGFAGGLLAIDAVLEWATSESKDVPIVLRTQDIDERRSIGAVLAAELLGQPLRWWGKNPQDGERLLGFLEARLKPDGHLLKPSSHGAMVVQPVRLSTTTVIAEVPLGSQLFAGERSKVWPRLGSMADQDAASSYGGKADSNKFFDDDLKWTIAALNQLGRVGKPLHELEGTVVLVNTLIEDIFKQRLRELETAMGATSSVEDPDKRSKMLDVLRVKRKRVENKIVADFDPTTPKDRGISETAKASHSQSAEQYFFIGTYGAVLCHPKVNEIFGRLYSPSAQEKSAAKHR